MITTIFTVRGNASFRTIEGIIFLGRNESFQVEAGRSSIENIITLSNTFPKHKFLYTWILILYTSISKHTIKIPYIVIHV